MTITLKVEDSSDLELLLPLLKRLNISISSDSDSSVSNTVNYPPLSKYIGKHPSIDVSAFEDYLKQSRDEWDRNIY